MFKVGDRICFNFIYSVTKKRYIGIGTIERINSDFYKISLFDESKLDKAVFWYDDPIHSCDSLYPTYKYCRWLLKEEITPVETKKGNKYREDYR